MKTRIIFLLFFVWLSFVYAKEPTTRRSLTNFNVEFRIENFRGEEREFRDIIRKIEIGDGYFALGNWYLQDALSNYLVAWEFNPNNAELNYKIALCYLNTTDKSSSLYFFERALDLGIENVKIAEPAEFYYHYARANHYSHRFDEALNAIDRAYQAGIAGLRLEKELEQLRRYVENAKQMVNAPVSNVKVQLLKGQINTIHSEYAPVLFPSGNMLMFTSRRPENTGGMRDEQDFMFTEDIFEAYINEGEWSVVANSFWWNTKYNEATVSISHDGSRLILYRGDKGGDLWEMFRLADGSWSKPVRMPSPVNSRWSETTAFYSPDGKKLYFISDRPGGYGGKDIYVAHRLANGSWGNVKNLGPIINTPYDEEGLYVSRDGKRLYFSSKGHNSMGGYDVFVTELVDGQWTKPQNLGYPINDVDDDVFFIMNRDETFALLASERSGNIGSRDIYQVTFMPEQLFAMSNYVLRVVDRITLEPVIFSELTIRDVRSGDTVIHYHRLNGDEFTNVLSLLSPSKYIVSVSAPEYERLDVVLNTKISDGQQDVWLQMDIANPSALIVEPVYFDFDKYDLRYDSEMPLKQVQKILYLYPMFHVEVLGHTDNVGSWEYNVWLSRQRAETVRNDLIRRGISAERIHTYWFSYDVPASDNETDYGRQLNRRVEFRFVRP